MEPNLKAVETLNYEEAFAELEKISAMLEANPASLEDNLALMERGLALVKHCSTLLDQAELKVIQLTGDEINRLQLDGQD